MIPVLSNFRDNGQRLFCLWSKNSLLGKYKFLQYHMNWYTNLVCGGSSAVLVFYKRFSQFRKQSLLWLVDKPSWIFHSSFISNCNLWLLRAFCLKISIIIFSDIESSWFRLCFRSIKKLWYSLRFIEFFKCPLFPFRHYLLVEFL